MKKLFLCTCNKSLDKLVDFTRVEKEALSLYEVVETHDSLCLSEGMEFISERTKDEDRVVVGACSSQIIGVPLSRKMRTDLVQIVPIREHVAWAHSDDSSDLAKKAVVLLADASVRVDFMDAPSEVPAASHSTVLVIGGGLAGLEASIALNRIGAQVALLEPEDFDLDNYLELSRFMEDSDTIEKTTKKLLKGLKGVKRFKGSISQFSGSAGAFEAIIVDHSGEEKSVACGAVIVASGSEFYMPPISKLSLYGRSERSVSLASLLHEKRKTPGKILLAVDNSTYLTGIEGSNILRCATLLAQQGNTVFVPHLDIMTNDENLYRSARNSGVVFVRGTLKKVSETNDGLVCRLENKLESPNRQFVVDFIAVCESVRSAGRTESLAEVLGLSLDEFGYIKTRYSKMKPVQTTKRGILVAGNAKMPMGLSEVLASAQNAALEAFKLVRSSGKRTGWIPAIDQDACDVCKACTLACPNDALRVLDDEIVHIPSHCEFCGICVAACPTRAIELQSFGKEGLFKRMDAIADTHKRLEREKPFTLVFACSECPNASIDQAGFAGKQYSMGTYTMQFPCAGMVSPIEILKGLTVGANKVIVAHCPPGGCHHQNGDHMSDLIVEFTQSLLKEIGQDPERVRATYMIAALPNKMQEEVGFNE
ncbi:MAG: hydrogenase iron-sulfur subunit [Candidatus Thorarchaeota archaeon]